jgi:TolB protein
MPRFLASLFLMIAPLSTALAQGFVIDVAGGQDTPLALPMTVAPNGDPNGEADVLWSTIHKDLDISGYFTIIDKDATIEGADAGIEPGTFDMADWSLLKATVLVKTRLLAAGDARCDPTGKKVCADVYVYYVVNGEKLMSTRFRAGTGDAVYLGHHVANQVLQIITGKPGQFGTPITAVGSQSGNKEIYLLDILGKGVRPVTRNGSINLSPGWSPTGSAIAWTSYKKANPDLYVKVLGSGRTRVLSNLRGINTSPAWHPGGTKIAMARSKDGDSDIYVVDAQSGKVIERVTKGGGIDVSPNWSADGNLLAFASERSGGSQVYVKNYTTGETNRVTFVGNFNTDPVISPNGDRIAFVGRSQGGFDIYVAGMDGRNPIRITQDMRDNEDPSWSPDGQHLLFSSTRTGRSELWMSTEDGRHQVQLTTSGGWTQPAFAPMGPGGS